MSEEKRQSMVSPSDIQPRGRKSLDERLFTPPGEGKSGGIKESVDKLTLHGISDLFDSTTIFGRVLWTLVLFGSITAASWGVYRSVQDFRYSPIMTSYSLKPKEALRFPHIYICPNQPIDCNTIYPLSEEEKTVLYENQAKKYLSSGQGEDAESILGQSAKVWDQTDRLGTNSPGEGPIPKQEQLPETLPDIFRFFGWWTGDFLRECGFGQRPVTCKDVTTRLFDKNNGLCYLVQLDRNQTVEGAGFQVVIDINRDRYPFKPLLEGVSVGIYDTFDPAASAATKFQISPGGKTKVSLEATHLRLINYENAGTHQECKELNNGSRSKFTEFMTLRNMPYTVASCRSDCIQKTAFATCQCSLPLELDYLKTNYHKLCSPDEIRDCFYGKVMQSIKLEEEMSQCIRESCVIPCESWQFQQSVSFIPFANDSWTVDTWKPEWEKPGWSDGENKTWEEKKWEGEIITTMAPPRENWDSQSLGNTPKEDLIILDIAYSKIQYTEVTQTPSMTLETCASNIGGQLGLWMGASILSVIQLLGMTMGILTGCNGSKKGPPPSNRELYG